jgi:adenosylmethionine-8-amino-7-oxononanoate aminotransferase
MHPLAKKDHDYVWHPFTQMQDWLRTEPIVIVSGEGALLRDVRGREYLDANSSIWTNLHGHAHPILNAAIENQLKKISHSSALGLANEPASLLAERLVLLMAQGKSPRLGKVFFSDDGSTAMEVALKLAYGHARRVRGLEHPRFLSLAGAYHGDTVGAVSLGHIDLFHKSWSGMLFQTDQVMAPYCYRCPYNRARPARADARTYRICQWECVKKVSDQFEVATQAGNPYAAFVIEPLMQGAAGMIPQPDGYLSRIEMIVRDHGTNLIFDEVMTAFGRTGPDFAAHQERSRPDFVAVAKGLTGGYLPMAATFTTSAVFDAFLGEYSEFKTFFHGHSFTANQLGSAAALASLDLLRTSHNRREALAHRLQGGLQTLWAHPNVGDIRRVGLVAGVELVKEWNTREAFPLEARIGIRVCEAMARRGVLTRPIGNVVVVMPPYCISDEQLERLFEVFNEALREILPIVSG